MKASPSSIVQKKKKKTGNWCWLVFFSINSMCKHVYLLTQLNQKCSSSDTSRLSLNFFICLSINFHVAGKGICLPRFAIVRGARQVWCPSLTIITLSHGFDISSLELSLKFYSQLHLSLLRSRRGGGSVAWRAQTTAAKETRTVHFLWDRPGAGGIW